VNRVLVVGLPRSGTTWVGRVLAATPGTEYVGEPDNPLRFPFALRACRQLGSGHYPILVPDDDAPDYERLWACAFGLTRGGGLDGLRRAVSRRLLQRSSPARVRSALRGEAPGLPLRAVERLAVPEEPRRLADDLLVKSVYAPLSVEWIARRIPLKIAVVLRSPLNILSSWVQLGWLGRSGDDMLDLVSEEAQWELTTRWSVPPPESGTSVVARAAWVVGAFSCGLIDAAARNPGWIVIRHEDLCAAPSERYRTLADTLGLTWSEGVEEVLAHMNRPGRGMEPFRVAGELGDVWRTRLTPQQIDEALTVLDRFPLDERLVSRVP
jgi:hypothetical protein